MGWVIKFAKSSVGAKILMALTGVVLVLFVLGHMAGNLQVLRGREPLNNYAAMLQSLGGALWVVRVGLLAALLLHVVSGLRLALVNLEARPRGYEVKGTVQASWSSRTMAVTGLLTLAFLVFHLLHFTLGVVHGDFYHTVDPAGRHDVYAMVVKGFQDPLTAGSYIVAMTLLGLHLSHGVSSLFQSLGLNHPRYNPVLRTFGPIVGAVVVVGNVAMPVAVLLSIVTLPVGGL